MNNNNLSFFTIFFFLSLPLPLGANDGVHVGLDPALAPPGENPQVCCCFRRRLGLLLFLLPLRLGANGGVHVGLNPALAHPGGEDPLCLSCVFPKQQKINK